MLLCRAADAAPRVVLIAKTAASQPSSPATAAATPSDAVPAQIDAELKAAGYEVVHVKAPSATLDDLSAAAEAHQAVAAIGVSAPADPPAADVWVTDKTRGKTVIRRVTADPSDDDAPRVLALQVVETLHASLVEIGVEPARPDETTTAPPAPVEQPRPAIPPSPTPPPSTPKRTQPTRSAPRPRMPAQPSSTPRQEIRIAIGPAAVGGPGDLPVAASVAARIGLRWSDRWSTELRWLGPVETDVSEPTTPSIATAQVDQELCALSLAVAPIPRAKPIEPFVALGLGVERVGAAGNLVAGSSSTAYRVKSTSGWFPFAELGIGARMRVWRTLGVLLAVDGAVTFERPTVRFETTSRPVQQPVLDATLALEWSI